MTEYETLMLEQMREIASSLKNLPRLLVLLEQLTKYEEIVVGTEQSGCKKTRSHRVVLVKSVD